MNIKEKLLNGEVVVGTWLNSGSPIIGELLAQCGYDFICVDAEHSPVDINQTFSIFQGITSGNSKCICGVRLHGVDYSLTKRYLDAGAQLIIGPLVNDANDAQNLIEAVKYPPLGKRGLGFCRANNYGGNVKNHFNKSNQESLVAVQIEDKVGVENIDEILKTPGIDIVFIGPYDLSASLGITAEFENDLYIKARNKILHACHRYNKIAGIHVVDPDINEVMDRIKEGYRFIAFSLDITILQKTSMSFFEKLSESDTKNI
jgi:2-dehydro-3-deoxyglucarate aldolase